MNCCCADALKEQYCAWLSRVGARDHSWMLDNLHLVLAGSIGSVAALDGEFHSVRVAWIGHADDRFTWAKQLRVECVQCRATLTLCVVTSNAMFFLMRVLLTAAMSFESVRAEPGRTIFRLQRDASPRQLGQLHAAMEVYRGHQPLTDAGLEELIQDFLQTVPSGVQAAARALHLATITWLLLHELGHHVTDQAGISPFARQYLSSSGLILQPGREAAWLDELSADLTACHLLAGAVAEKHRPLLGEREANRAGLDLGFGAGIVALVVFELYEGYDAGRRSISGATDVTRDIAFAKHPPMLHRQQFLAVCAKAAGGINPTITNPWRHALTSLFADYVDHYPIPE